MNLLKALRNSTMHSRPLVPYEESLVLGVVGLIRNRVTTYRSEKGPDMQYYPTITRVTDNFGNELTSQSDTGLHLQPGDVVTFTCVGTDPQQRLLTWELRTQSRGNSMIQMDGDKGEETLLTWNVHEQEVRQHATVEIEMWSAGEHIVTGNTTTSSPPTRTCYRLGDARGSRSASIRS